MKTLNVLEALVTRTGLTVDKYKATKKLTEEGDELLVADMWFTQESDVYRVMLVEENEEVTVGSVRKNGTCILKFAGRGDNTVFKIEHNDDNSGKDYITVGDESFSLENEEYLISTLVAELSDDTKEQTKDENKNVFLKLVGFMNNQKFEEGEVLTIYFSEKYETYVGEFTTMPNFTTLIGVEGELITFEEDDEEGEGNDEEILSMGEQKAMTLELFNKFMSKCKGKQIIRYVTPTIHPHFKIVVAIEIQTSTETKKFSITNNADENFNLNEAVNEYIETL